MPTKPLIQRHEMLRHNEFHQFGRTVLGKESSPHEVHWAIRDVLQDAGATIDKQADVNQSVHWSMTQEGSAGLDEGCESDYLTFNGSIIASKGKHLPSWLPIAIVMTCVLGLLLASTSLVLTVVFLLASLGLGVYAYWLIKYQRGKLFARYEGVYRRPEAGAQNAAV